MSNVWWLGFCDFFFCVVFVNGGLEKIIDSMKYLEKLDLSYCVLFKDRYLMGFVCCSNLEVFSVWKCLFLIGSFVEYFLEFCVEFKIFILDGISLDDEIL